MRYSSHAYAGSSDALHSSRCRGAVVRVGRRPEKGHRRTKPLRDFRGHVEGVDVCENQVELIEAKQILRPLRERIRPESHRVQLNVFFVRGLSGGRDERAGAHVVVVSRADPTISPSASRAPTSSMRCGGGSASSYERFPSHPPRRAATIKIVLSTSSLQTISAHCRAPLRSARSAAHSRPQRSGVLAHWIPQSPASGAWPPSRTTEGPPSAGDQSLRQVTRSSSCDRGQHQRG
jgi:hypothetical protein